MLVRHQCDDLEALGKYKESFLFFDKALAADPKNNA
jgi:hypothetical protein